MANAIVNTENPRPCLNLPTIPTYDYDTRYLLGNCSYRL